MSLIAFLLMQKATLGERVKAFCDRHLIADDPYPYGKTGNLDLLLIYADERSDEARREIVFRLSSGLFSVEQVHIALGLLNGGAQ